MVRNYFLPLLLKHRKATELKYIRAEEIKLYVFHMQKKTGPLFSSD